MQTNVNYVYNPDNTPIATGIMGIEPAVPTHQIMEHHPPIQRQRTYNYQKGEKDIPEAQKLKTATCIRCTHVAVPYPLDSETEVNNYDKYERDTLRSFFL